MPVAIKQLRDDRIDAMAGGYEAAKEEFFKEARIFRLMNHPNLVQVKRWHFDNYTCSLCPNISFFEIKFYF